MIITVSDNLLDAAVALRIELLAQATERSAPMPDRLAISRNYEEWTLSAILEGYQITFTACLAEDVGAQAARILDLLSVRRGEVPREES